MCLKTLDLLLVVVGMKQCCIFYRRRMQISYVHYKHRTDQKGLKSVSGERYNLLYTASKPALGPTQPPIQWYEHYFAGNKAARL